MTVGIPGEVSAVWKALENLREIVAVNFQDVPAEGGVLRGEGVHVHDLFDPAVNLKLVFVHDGAEVVEFVVARGHGRFPDVAFLLFTVTHDAKDAVGPAGQLCGQRAAHGDAQSLAQ